ncbi:MAG: radical SAM protein, partial [Candidatus Aminicenantes bacterium]
PMRGCPESCGYCCEPKVVGRKMVTRKIANIIEELIQLKSMGIHHVYFCDSEINLCNREYLFDFCEQLNGRQVGITWTASMYPDPKTVSHKLLTLMKNAGCCEIIFGSDSGCDEILAGMGKWHTAGDSVIFTEYLRKAGIRPLPAYLIGWPGESTKTIEETFDHIKRCQFEEVIMEAGIRIYPDTKIARIAMDEGMISKDTNLMDPTFYNPDQVLQEFIPYIRRRAKDMANTILYPTRAIDFIHLFIRNFFLIEGYRARGIGDFIAHMNNLPRMKKLKILGRTALDFALPFRRRFIPLCG